MNLDGARNAKADVFAKAFDYDEAPGVFAAGTVPAFVPRPPSARMLKAHGGGEAARKIISDRELIAVGIRAPVPGSNEGEHELVLLCQKKRLTDHPIVERARRIAKGDVRVIYTGPAQRYSSFSPARRRPLHPGCSVAHHRVTAGTLGAFVRRDLGGICILSNNHVLANVNAGAPGDAVWQPGKRDGGVAANDRVGTLHHFVPVLFGTTDINYVDCAVATLAADQVCEPADLIDPATGTAFAKLTGTTRSDFDAEEPVMKVGRTTGRTHGRVFAVEVDQYVVNMGSAQKPKPARFDNQFQVYSPSGHFGKPGDSGSLIVDEAGNACGLLFAGTVNGGPSGFGLITANPIDQVLAELSAELYVG